MRPKRGAAYFIAQTTRPEVYWPKGGATPTQFINAVRGCLGLAPIGEETANPQGRGRKSVRAARRRAESAVAAE